jgi:hypothetical protein
MLYDRLLRFEFDASQLDDKSLYQLVTILFLLVGHRNYLPCFTTACRTMEELLGEQAFYARENKPENIVNDTEPKPVVH